MLPKKKKLTLERKYKKGSVGLPNYNIRAMLDATTSSGKEVDLLAHTCYDDGSQSVTVTIHFTPNEKTNG